MRRYRKKRGYGKRRRFKKDNKMNRPVTKLLNLKTGIPDRVLVPFNYTCRLSLADAVGGVGAIQVYRGNSIYDPDYTGGGGQPMARDEWANFYNYYRVFASSIYLKLFPLSSTLANANLIVAVSPNLTVGTTATDTINYLEYPYAKIGYCGAGNGGNITTIRNYMSVKKMFGQTNTNDDNYAALQTNNPANQFYWNISVDAVDGISLFDLDCIVSITYYAELSDRVKLAAS